MYRQQRYSFIYFEWSELFVLINSNILQTTFQGTISMVVGDLKCWKWNDQFWMKMRKVLVIPELWNGDRNGNNNHFLLPYNCYHKTTKTMQKSTKSDDSLWLYDTYKYIFKYCRCDRFSIHQLSIDNATKANFPNQFKNNNRNQRRNWFHWIWKLDDLNLAKTTVWHISKRWRHIQIVIVFHHYTECGFWM